MIGFLLVDPEAFFTQEDFARKLGISRATLDRLESATQNTTLNTLDQIIKSLHCSVGDLFD